MFDCKDDGLMIFGLAFERKAGENRWSLRLPTGNWFESLLNECPNAHELWMADECANTTKTERMKKEQAKAKEGKRNKCECANTAKNVSGKEKSILKLNLHRRDGKRRHRHSWNPLNKREKQSE